MQRRSPSTSQPIIRSPAAHNRARHALPFPASLPAPVARCSAERPGRRRSTASAAASASAASAIIRMSYYSSSALVDALRKVQGGFVSLRGSPVELWKAYALKFLDSYSYFSLSIIFTLFLSADFGYTDVQSGTIYGAWGAMITIFGLVTGFVIDNLGVARSLRLGFIISLLARCGIFWTSSRTVVLFHVMVTLPLGNCLGIPVLATGIRRYTNESNRGFAFGLFYVIMNVAALISGPIVDTCTILYKGGEDEDEKGNSEYDGTWTLSGYRMVVLSGVVANVVACAVAFTVREIKVDGSATSISGSSSPQPVPRLPPAPPPRQVAVAPDEEMVVGGTVVASHPHQRHQPTGGVTTFRPAKGSASEILRETMKSRNFWRFLVVCLILLNVRMIFRHLDATLPKYMIREFGEDVPKGTIYSINPALIIVLVPIVTAATTNVDPLVMIHYGSYISAASVFFLAVSTSLWSCVMFVVVLSVGEAVWSPRLYDYTVSVTKEGREGTYMALSSAPLFLAKLPVGFMSGYLLQKYCPEDGPRNSKVMWTIIGLTTASSPIMLTVLWKYVSDKSEDDEAPYEDIRSVVHDDGGGGETDQEYQHLPLKTEISLPRVRPTDRGYMGEGVSA